MKDDTTAELSSRPRRGRKPGRKPKRKYTKRAKSATITQIEVPRAGNMGSKTLLLITDDTEMVASVIAQFTGVAFR